VGTSQSDIQSLGTLPEGLKETSGLIFYNNRLITHNDSGNAPELYELDVSTLEIVRTIRVGNAENIDWEDIAQDANFIYIGDIGNNQGDRMDLGILKISKEEFTNSDVVSPERIMFNYEDQTDFNITTDSDFDAEALFVLNNTLIVLTKQWQSLGTVAYKIPNEPGSVTAERMDTFQVDGLVTGATFDALSNTLFLVGYSEVLLPFFVEVPDVNETSLFSGDPIKAALDIGPTQVEAITLTNDTFYLSSEEFTNAPLINSASRLFTFSLDAMEVPNPNPDTGEPPSEELIVYKTFNGLELNYALNSSKPIFGMGIFDNQGRMISYIPLERITEQAIDISTFSQGVYHLAFFYGNTAISASFFRD